jgi:hypothetical protein
MSEPIQISITPPVDKSQDFAFLREQGLNIVQAVASETWTDHNLHDPGITMLEAFCYALTEMGLRTGMDMRDLVASDANGRKAEFFTAAQVLPVAPVTVTDFRKTLIDHPLVQNAWVYPLQTEPRGKHSVLLEFANELLNSSTFHVTVTPPGPGTDYNIDLAFPYWDDEDARPFSELVTLNSVTFDGTPGNEWNQIEGTDAYFARITVNYTPPAGPAANRILWIVAQVTTPMDNPLVELPVVLPLLTARVLSLVDNSPTDLALVRQFNHRTTDANNAMKVVRRYLKDYRNLSEDFTDYKAIHLQEIAVTAIIEVNTGVNIENLLADIFISIDKFISPINDFKSVDELLAGLNPDKIFEGPSMESGFLPDDNISTTFFPDALFTSDMLRLILQQRDQRGTDIVQREDVNTRNIAAVRNLSLANYLDGRPITTNARDCLQLVKSQRHIPRLSITKSRITLYRNQLEVGYDLNRVIDLFNDKKAALLQQEETEFADLPLPEGEIFPVSEYYPIQNDLPVIYGVSEAGLPDTATEERRALAMQLKGYLFFFEQLTASVANQLGNINSFFSADPTIDKTLFPQPLYHLPQVDKLLRSFDPAIQTWEAFTQNTNNNYITSLQQAAENNEQFLTRRNRVLNHLLAIFGEDMYDAAALAYHASTIVPDSSSLPLPELLAIQTEQRNAASRRLIQAKSDFFYDLPALNRDRAQSFGNPVWRNANLLQIQPVAGGYNWQVLNADGTVLLRSVTPAASDMEARRLAASIFSLGTMAANYTTRNEGGGVLRLVIQSPPDLDDDLVESLVTFNSPAAANNGITKMVTQFVQLWTSFAITPLEARMYHMLSISIKERRTLLHNINDYFEIFDVPPPITKHFRLWESVGFGGAELLTGDIDYTGANNALATAAAQKGIQTAISRGVLFDSYEIINPAANIYQVVLLLPDNTVLAHSANFATEELARQQLFRIWRHLFRLFSVQGFYLVEHLLLAPVTSADATLTAVNTTDPYPFQMSFVFPSGYANNFSIPNSVPQETQPSTYRDPEFRKFTEQQIRKACPAHILPRVLWVDSALPGSPIAAGDPCFDNFEARYRAWLTAYLTEGTTEAVIAPLRNQLVTVLNNIYSLLEV